MRKTYELPDRTRREVCWGLGLAIPAITAWSAPGWHDQAVLGDLSITVEEWRVETVEIRNQPVRAITVLRLTLHNGGRKTITPVFSTWDQKRRTRHNWPIERGPDALVPGEADTYRIAAPNDEAVLHPGLRAQLTVFNRGEERWATHTFTPEQ